MRDATCQAHERAHDLLRRLKARNHALEVRSWIDSAEIYLGQEEVKVDAICDVRIEERLGESAQSKIFVSRYRQAVTDKNDEARHN